MSVPSGLSSAWAFGRRQAAKGMMRLGQDWSVSGVCPQADRPSPIVWRARAGQPAGRTAVSDKNSTTGAGL